MKICLVGPCSPSDVVHLLFPTFKESAESIRAFRGVPVSALAEALVEDNHEVTLITTSSEVHELRIFQGQKFTLMLLPQRVRARDLALTLYSKEIYSISKILRKLNVDVIHAHWTYEYAIASIFSCKNLVVTAHDAPWQVFMTAGSRKFWIFRLILAWIARLFVKNMVFVSEDLESKWRREMFWRRNSRVIPNIPPFEINNASKEFRLQGIFRILTVGDASARKNVAGSIEAIRYLKDVHPFIELHIVGIGLGRNEPYSNNHAESDYFSNLHWHGYLERSELKSLMLKCDVLLQPSLLESFGLSLLEGMALGLPVIAGLNTGAAKEVVGDAGILIDTRDTSEIISSLKMLIDNPKIGLDLSERGKRRISTKFSRSHILTSTIEYYLEVQQKRKNKSLKC